MRIEAGGGPGRKRLDLGGDGSKILECRVSHWNHGPLPLAVFSCSSSTSPKWDILRRNGEGAQTPSARVDVACARVGTVSFLMGSQVLT